MSRNGLTFYFHLCSGYKITYSDYAENLSVIQVYKAYNHTKSGFLETTPWSQALRLQLWAAAPGAAPPQLQLLLWALGGSPSGLQEEVCPQITGAASLKRADRQRRLGRWYSKENRTLWGVSEFPGLEFPSKILRAHPSWALSLSLTCSPRSSAGLSWEHFPNQSLALELSSQGLLLGDPPTVLQLMF